MDLLTIVLRIVHIVSGVLWVGGAVLFFVYIEPTVNKLGPDAEKFVEEVVRRRKLPVYFMLVSTLTVVAGVLLYWGRFDALEGTAMGLALGLGGLAAIIAWLAGNLLIPRFLARIGGIAAEMKAAGGPPSAELIARMQAAQGRLRTIGTIDVGLLAFAVVAMASARYLG